MANYNPKSEYLVRQKPNWRNLPTKAIRVPEAFAPEIEKYARALDEGNSPSFNGGVGNICRAIAQLNKLEDLLKVKTEVEFCIVDFKERQCDRRLEQAILFLAGRCDRARAKDGAGFSGADTGFGHWLADRISQKYPLIKAHAKAALRMVQKYKNTQLPFELPVWDAIAHQYPDSYQPTNLKEEKPDKRIEVIGNAIAVFAPYDSTGKFQRDAKSIEGYKFNSTDKSWRYPLDRVEEVVAKWEDFEIDENVRGAIALVQMQKEEERIEKERQATEAATGIIKLIESADLDKPLPCGWNLFEHQKEAIKWLLSHRKGGLYYGGILADDMGLGKSISSLVAAKAMKTVYNCHIFVIAPVSLRDNWLIEAERVGVEIEVFSWAKIPSPIESSKYVAIADESHLAQDERSQRTQKLMELTQHDNCMTSWLLSGTPCKNGRPINLYPLLKIAGHPLAEDRLNYQKRYCAAYHRVIKDRQIWDVTGAAHLDELSKKTEDIILRRTKKECLNLPPKIRSFKPVELESAQQKAYQKTIEELKADYQRRIKLGEVDEGAEAIVTLNILRKVGSSYKVESAIALVEELLEQGQQAVVFTEFLDSANQLYTRLSELAPCELLTGETKQDDRQRLVERFQSGQSKVFIGTIKAGGVGITLTAASNVVLVNRPWTPGDAIQAEDRCDRIGQNETVNAYWIQLGLVDQCIDAMLEQKQERIELVLKGKRKTLRGLSSVKELAKELMELI